MISVEATQPLPMPSIEAGPHDDDRTVAPPRTWVHAIEEWWEQSRLAGAASLLILVVVPLVLVGLHLSAYPQLSPADEQAHADYVVRAPGLLPVVSGDRWSEEVLRAEACRGIDSGFVPPPCDSPVLRPEQFELLGYNTAYIHPPTYYNATAIVADVLVAVGAAGEVFGAARATGALWLIAGMLVAWWSARNLGASRRSTLGALMLVMGAPGIVLMSSTITPDASNMLVGAVIVAAVIKADKGLSRWTVVCLVAAGLISSGIKLQNVIGLAPPFLYLVLRAAADARAMEPGRRIVSALRSRFALSAGLLVVPAAVVAVGWSAVWAAAAEVPPDELPAAGLLAGDPLGLAYLAFGDFLPPTAFYQAESLVRLPVLAWSQVTDWLIIGALFTAIVAAAVTGLSTGRLRELSAWSWACVVAGVLGGPVLVALSYLTLGTAFPIPERYGATMLIPMILVVAGIASGVWAQRALLAAGVITVGLEVIALTVG